jgi:hypothetical protein
MKKYNKISPNKNNNNSKHEFFQVDNSNQELQISALNE